MAVGDKIFIADKPTLDSVKQDTNYIKGQFPIDVGENWDKYKNYYNKVRLPVIEDNKTHTVIDIKGKGYFRDIVFSFNKDSKITIYKDGEVISIDTELKGGGFEGKSLLAGVISPQDSHGIMASLGASYMYASCIYIPKFETFKTSLKVDISSVNYNTIMYADFMFLGGVEK